MRSYYAIDAMRDRWLDKGHLVIVGRDFAPEADVCVLHRDRTVLTKDDIPPAPEGVPVINDSILDISKRRISTNLLSPASDWSGKVIIKTNHNAFGNPEKRDNRGLYGRLRRHFARFSWRSARMLPKGLYPILNTLGDVPDWVWRSDELVVEKFLPEMDGDLFCLRGWLFLGNKGYCYRLFATHPLVKVGSMVRYEYLETVPDELQAIRTKLQFDFGKFDFVMREGQLILLDANKTPSFTGPRDTPRFKMLASGIEDFFA
ncbi:MAG: hypothetical protein AAGF28_02590 [Pseudomonadota bacterium]